MEEAPGHVSAEQERAITPHPSAVGSSALVSAWKSLTAQETGHGLPGLLGRHVAPAAALAFRFASVPAVTQLLATEDECVSARTAKNDTVMNTCPAHHTSTGLPGRHGNAATCPAAAASNHDAGLVRTATTALGVDRSTSHATLFLVLS